MKTEKVGLKGFEFLRDQPENGICGRWPKNSVAGRKILRRGSQVAHPCFFKIGLKTRSTVLQESYKFTVGQQEG